MLFNKMKGRHIKNNRDMIKCSSKNNFECILCCKVRMKSSRMTNLGLYVGFISYNLGTFR